MLEIVLGIVIGPSGLGWVQPDLPVSILSLRRASGCSRPRWPFARVPLAVLSDTIQPFPTFSEAFHLALAKLTPAPARRAAVRIASDAISL